MLLDTHIFLWWLFDDRKLPINIREYIQDIDNAIYVSAASVWEISTKYRLGKLPEASEVAKDVSKWVLQAGFQPLNVTLEHAQLAGSWDVSHRDPFDRMLAAQAKLEQIPLATIDVAMSQFPIKIINN
ncbi:MAG: type II toxin-antitoxin system VapC family toxin [Desulfatiglans sp.]|jgi:PIN domain nuclease of toxin-antitoxin system|nr:type II toxin-antitoxin system VapC family toxin [Desulfatiglans sp.]